MRRTVVLALLWAWLLCAVTVEAQRVGGFIGGSGFRVGVGFGHGGHFQAGIRGGRGGRFLGHHRFGRFSGEVAAAVPLWYGDSFGYEDIYTEPVLNSPTTPSVIVVQPPPPIRSEDPVPQPKLIEVPNSSSSVVARSLSPAIFVVKNGQRLQAGRYMLTHDTLFFTADHQQRSLPVSALDLEATLAANRSRGVELRIPADRSEISLGF